MRDPVKFLTQRAMRGFESLSDADQQQLLKGILAVMPTDSSEHQTAQHLLFLKREAERAQTTFLTLIDAD